MTQSADNRWLFDLSRMMDSPSKRDGIGNCEELCLRQKGTNLIRDIAQTYRFRPIIMQTAMVYFHRFFTLRSFKRFDVNRMAICSLFLASKWEDHPIPGKTIVKMAVAVKPKPKLIADPITSESIEKETERLVGNESEMLYTFGFDLSIKHSLPIIIESVIPKIIQKNAYIINADLLRMTTICLQFKPSFIACICIYLSSTFLHRRNELSIDWCQKIDPSIQLSDVEEKAQQFIDKVVETHLTFDENNTSHSNPVQASPDSAYSSGTSPESVDTEPQSNRSKLDAKSYSLLNKCKEVNNNRKRSFEKVFDQSQARERSLHSKAILNYGPHHSTKGSNGHNVSVPSMPHPSKDRIPNPQKYHKVVNSNGEANRRAVQTPTSAQVAVSSAPNQVKSSSTVTDPSLICKNQFKKLNLKITISTNADPRTTDKKRVVCSEPLVNSTHITT